MLELASPALMSSPSDLLAPGAPPEEFRERGLPLRLGVLTEQIGPELVDQAGADAGRVQRRCRHLPARAVVYFVLALCLFSGADSSRPPGYRSVLRSLTTGLRQLHGIGASGRSHDATVQPGTGTGSGRSHAKQPRGPSLRRLAPRQRDGEDGDRHGEHRLGGAGGRADVGQRWHGPRLEPKSVPTARFATTPAAAVRSTRPPGLRTRWTGLTVAGPGPLVNRRDTSCHTDP